LQVGFNDDKEGLQIKIKQLEILSLLRGEDIQIKVVQEEEKMPVSIDITKDLRYQQGIQKGEEKGFKIGEEKGFKIGEEKGFKIGEEQGFRIGERRGEEKKALEIAIKMLESKSFTNAQIAEFSGVQLAVVEQMDQSKKRH